MSGSAHVKYSLCLKEYKSSGETSHLMVHLKLTDSSENLTQQSTQREQNDVKKRNVGDYKWASKKVSFLRNNQKTANFIALECQSFSVKGEKVFRELVNELEPRCEIPSIKYVNKSLVPDLYAKRSIKLLNIEDIEEVIVTTNC